MVIDVILKEKIEVFLCAAGALFDCLQYIVVLLLSRIPERLSRL